MGAAFQEVARSTFGRGRLSVTSVGIAPFTAPLEVKDDDDLLVFRVKESPSVGSVLAWSLGGSAAGVGAALVAVGAPTGIRGLVYAGIPTLLVGAAVTTLGFFFDERVTVAYPHWWMTP